MIVVGAQLGTVGKLGRYVGYIVKFIVGDVECEELGKNDGTRVENMAVGSVLGEQVGI